MLTMCICDFLSFAKFCKTIFILLTVLFHFVFIFKNLIFILFEFTIHKYPLLFINILKIRHCFTNPPPLFNQNQCILT